MIRLLVLAALSLPAFAQQDFNHMARKVVRSSHDAAEGWAHYLAISDLVTVMSASMTSVVEATMPSSTPAELQEIQKQYESIVATVRSAGKESPDEARKILSQALTDYRAVFQRHYARTWTPVLKQYNRDIVVQIINRGIDDYKRVCSLGRSAPQADVGISPFHLPNLALNIRLSPSTSTVVNVNMRYSSGTKSMWQSQKDALKLSAHTMLGMAAMGAASTAGVAAATYAVPVMLAVEMVFILIDHFVSAHELGRKMTKLAKAYSHIFENAATNGDIGPLYSLYCQSISEGLNDFKTIFNMMVTDPKHVTEVYESAEFGAAMAAWNESQEEARQASCRANLQQNFSAGQCEPVGKAAKPLEFVNEPACARVMEKSQKADQVCPKIEIVKENGCRIDSTANRVQFIELSVMPECKIPTAGYDCSVEHQEDLVTAGLYAQLAECKGRPEAERAKQKKLEEAERVYQETLANCLKNQNNNKGNTCLNQADNAKKLAVTETLKEIEDRQIEEMKRNSDSRETQRARFSEEMKESGRLLAYLAAGNLLEHDKTYRTTVNASEIVMLARENAKEAILSLIGIVNRSVTNKDFHSSVQVEREMMDLQREFVQIGAEGILNIVKGKETRPLVQNLLNLQGKFDVLAIREPSLLSSSFSSSVKALIEELNQ